MSASNIVDPRTEERCIPALHRLLARGTQFVLENDSRPSRARGVLVRVCEVPSSFGGVGEEAARSSSRSEQSRCH
jgi:hypothetical protein